MHLLVLGAFWPAPFLALTPPCSVLMHLLVLGAFWRPTVSATPKLITGLNAPSGAGCFLAFAESYRVILEWTVLMHLLVLGAF